MNMSKRAFLLILLLLYGPGVSRFAFSQSSAENRSRLQETEESQKAFLRAYYSTGSGFENDLVFGQEYYAYHSRSDNKPLMYTDNLYTSSIVFNGKYYDGIKLQYDTYTDEVVYTDLNLFLLNFTSSQIALNEDKIEMFSFYRLGDTLNFYRIDEEGSNLEPGFYEIPYQGTTRFVIKHYSYAYMERSIYQYKIKKTYYLDTGEGFYKFKSKKQFIKIFGENAGLIKSVIDKKNIRFSRKNDSSIVSVLKEYDQMLLLSDDTGR